MWNWREEAYFFEDFIVGNANKNAYDMVHKFMNPSCDFNLLFLTGNVGSGKTYLAKAVETELMAQNKSVKMLNSDQFLGDLIWYLGRNIENHGIEVFSREYEKYNVLIFEDLQFLEGKEATQKYFAYLLSRFVMKQKKVLITSVKELSEYKWLQEALNKNEVQIQNVQIQDADVELKKNILESLEKKWGYQLSAKSKNMIVENEKNLRQLEGMFKKMMAYAQLMGVECIEQNKRKV